VILVIEPIFPNEHHAAHNAGMLRAILLAASGEEVVFVAHALHHAAVRAILGDAVMAGLRCIDIDVLPPGGISWRRFLSQARSLVGWTRRLKARIVICLGTTPETLFACRILGMIRRNIRIFAILHGNLDQANGWRSRDPRRRWFDDRASLTIAVHPAIRFVLLERNIEQDAIRLGLLPRDRCLVWPHPLNEQEVWSGTASPDPGCLRIAFVGLAKHSKGFGDFLTLARRIRSVSDRHCFSLIGGLYGEFPPEDLACVEIPDGPLDRAEFLRRLHEADYVCLPLREGTYTLTASGSLIDAVAALRPLIALPTPAVRDLFADGPVGYLCEDIAAMEAVLRDADRLADPQAYAGFQANMGRQRARRLPPALAGVIASALR
jgi:glycosyltransferase involved in cell wall biosynthesis